MSSTAEEPALGHDPPRPAGSVQISSSKKRRKSETQKTAARAAKKAELRAEQANRSGGNNRPCPTCLKNGVPIEQASSHSRASSSLCPYRIKPKRTQAKEAFGQKAKIFTIKTGLQRACRIPGLQQEISSAVERIRDITFEGSLLANRHFTRCMEEHGAVESDCFGQSFFLTCMKLVAGKDPKRPQDLKEETFASLLQTHEGYASLRPDNLRLPDPGHLWHALSASAANAEKDARNHITENFAKKAEEYIFFLLRRAADSGDVKATNKDLKRLATFVYESKAGATRDWPPSVQKTEELAAVVDGVADGINLGPVPVTEKALFARPHDYLPFFFKVLKFFEATAHSAREPLSKTSPPLTWLKRKMAMKVAEWKTMSKTGQRRVIAAVRRCMLQSGDPRSEPVIKSNLKTSLDYVLKLITKTQTKMKEQRFRPKMAVVPKHARLFTLHPLYSFQRRYIELDQQTLASLVNRAGGVVGTNLFWDAFDFTKIGITSTDELRSPRRQF